MLYHLVCVHPFHGYKKGNMITDADEVTKLLADREHHFNRIAIPEAPATAAPGPVLPSAEAPALKVYAK